MGQHWADRSRRLKLSIRIFTEVTSVGVGRQVRLQASTLFERRPVTFMIARVCSAAYMGMGMCSGKGIYQETATEEGWPATP